MLKDKDENLTGEDFREGLTAIVTVKLARPAVRGPDQDQARQQRGQGVRAEGRQRAARRLARGEPERGARRSSARRQRGGRAARRPARRASWPRPQGPALGGGLPGKLIRLQSTDPERVRALHRRGRLGRRLGQGRPRPRIQAILPIRGKILNVEKARIDRVLANNEVQALITAVGTGIGDEFDLDKLRYHKIVMMTDADVDGQHIRTLLLTFLFRFMRPLIEAARLPRAAAALPAEVVQGGVRVRLLRPRARRADGGRLEAGKQAAQGRRVQRYKGLGEMNAEELWETTMDPDAPGPAAGHPRGRRRRPTRCSRSLMGEDVESRRAFIQRNAKDVRFLDI